MRREAQHTIRHSRDRRLVLAAGIQRVDLVFFKDLLLLFGLPTVVDGDLGLQVGELTSVQYKDLGILQLPDDLPVRLASSDLKSQILRDSPLLVQHVESCRLRLPSRSISRLSQ